jgi:hypothetical protein
MKNEELLIKEILNKNYSEEDKKYISEDLIYLEERGIKTLSDIFTKKYEEVRRDLKIRMSIFDDLRKR